VEPDYSFYDIRNLSTREEKYEYIRKFKQEDKQRSFDLTQDVLMRLALIQVDDEEYNFIWTHHHIILDGWCTEILLAEFFEIYRSKLQGTTPVLPSIPPYRVYIEWLEKQDKDASISFWKDYLKDYDEGPSFPEVATDTPEYNRETSFITIEDNLFDQLNALSQKHSVTLNVIFQALWGITICRQTNRHDVVFGTVVSGRPPEVPGIESMLGLFVNTIPVRVTISDNEHFADIIRRLQARWTEIQSYSYESLADIQAEASLRPNAIDHLYGFQNYKRTFTDNHKQNNKEGQAGGYNVERLEVFEQTNYNFTIKILPGKPAHIMFEYNESAFSKEAIKALGIGLINLIEQVIADDAQKVGDLTLHTLDAAQKALIESVNNTATSYPADKSVVDLFNEVCHRYRDKTALRFGEVSVTYAELDAKSNQVAHFLLDSNLPQESIMAVYQSKGISLIATILGVIKAGYAYLPVNTELPLSRIKEMLIDSEAAYLLSESGFINEINRLHWEVPTLTAIVCLDIDDIESHTETSGNLMSKDLWEYVGENAEDEIDGGGWLSSYTGNKLSHEEMEEYADNTFEKLSPYLDSTARVLEIGCASGITMFRLAPRSREYVGTDLSQVVIDRNKVISQEKGFDNIRLACLRADEISQLSNSEPFNVIIINSVVQCFSGYNYLRSIIRQAMDLIDTRGIIFLGDLMDLDKREDMISTLMKYKDENPDAHTKLDFTDELFVSRALIDDLVADIPGITKADHSEKIHTLKNELTDFRFDSILTVDKEQAAVSATKSKFRYDLSDVAKYSADPVSKSVGPRQLFNVIYTSGSTGKPKGTLVEHRGIVRLVRNADYMTVTSDDVWGQTVDISFDPSTLEIFGALLNGASLCLVPKDVLLEPELYSDLIRTTGISMMVLITPIFHELASIDPGMFASMRSLIIGGEALQPRHVNAVLDECPDLEIINAYGPTENTVISTTYSITRPVEKMHIGKPMANSQAYVMDSQLNPVGIGTTGELCVSGSGLARGYLNRPDLTSERFVDHPLREGEKLYRTGDKARLLSDGNIDILGRIDEQVKIRGYRIEPAEIEKTLQAIHGVEDAAVVVTGNTSNKSLAAFVKSAESEDYLQQKLAGLLPPHMVPQQLTLVQEMPLTPNGKTDRKELTRRAAEHNEAFDGEGCPPGTETEEKLAAIWADILNRTVNNVRDNFFDIGGHSLKAMQVVSRITKTFQVRITLKEFFANPTISGLASAIQEKEGERFNPIIPVDKVSDYEVSHAQKRLWILDKYEDNQIAYNISGAFKFEGLDKKVFERVMQVIVNRHESLRTTFITIDGEPRQKIHDGDSLGIKLDHLDLSDIPLSEDVITGQLQKEMDSPFDLVNGPLVRMKLLQFASGTYAFIFTMHHIISDGWSMRILIEEVDMLYKAFNAQRQNPLEPLRIQYKDFVHWQNRSIEEKEEQYWLQKLSGDLNWINLPRDYAEVDYHAFKGGEVSSMLGREEKDKLVNLARQNNTSLSNVLFTIFNILLYNISNQKDIVVGIAIANRIHPEIEKIVGFFVNTLVIRTRISEDSEFEDTLNQVSENMIEAFDNQNYPFDLLVRKLNPERITNKQPVFNVLYGFQNFTDVEVIEKTEQKEASTISPNDNNKLVVNAFSQKVNSSKFDLTFFVYEEEMGIRLSFEYNSELFKESTISKWLMYFEKFVRIITQDQPVEA
ncbi:MAG: amino acid adenylation domain-containing protein, partial [Cyclobacteriaceae bacterium]